MKMICSLVAAIGFLVGTSILAEAKKDMSVNDNGAGLFVNVGGMPLYAPGIESRAISAENQTGAKGEGGKTLNGRKGLPCNWNLKKDEVFTFAEIKGPGVIRHIWITPFYRNPKYVRNLILRFYWDGQSTPSVEVPLGDFFGVSHGWAVNFESAFVSMREAKGFNCYFLMPFAKSAKLQVCNECGEDASMFFYQVDYTIGDAVTRETPYFHAQFRRVLNTKLAEDYVILDGVKGKGRFLGANIGIVDRFHKANVWWGEGEVKMYIDGDDKYPTICGTGSEDYACSAWGLGQSCSMESGAPVVDGKYISFYRFHARDPIYFSTDIKVTIQQLGNDGQGTPADPNGPLGEFIAKGEYRKDYSGGNFERVDDVCSTAYWYQTLPTQTFPAFPDKILRTADMRLEKE